MRRTKKKTSPGRPDPQGATRNENGVNFALFSQYAEAVTLVLFKKSDGKPTDIIPLENKTGHIWHVFVKDVGPGTFYGYKVKGKTDPAHGLHFNENKFLADPFARAFSGSFIYNHPSLNGFSGIPGKDFFPDSQDSTPYVPKSLIVDNTFDWQGDTPPAVPWEELILYEVHVKGFTAHPGSGVKYPGTYLGFIEKIPYLRDLGINAVELLPVQSFYTHDFLIRRNLANYWGYDTIGYFAPEYGYSTRRFPGCQVAEFKILVRELHKAGIEVILDVVYNHTGEGDHKGPTICFRGIDNPTYYSLKGPPEAPFRDYRNDAGTGNMLNIENPQVLNMVMDSMRYWVREMHVDGFRFDLATILGRCHGQYNSASPFFESVARDPVLKNVKLIAEPWDIVSQHQGNFPKDWSEWNDRFRNTVRRFLRGDQGQIADLGWRLTGSEDMFRHNGRTPSASINFITCHDGFTLYDLFSYNKKQNLANGEKNRDGSSENFSWNCGMEGETQNPDILKLRKRMIKNALCCLFLSAGTPMLLGGDEWMRTQRGNNNTWCQDNNISWFDWKMTNKNRDMLDFVKKIIALRKQSNVLKRNTFYTGEDTDQDGLPDILWFDKNGNPPSWQDPKQKCLCFLINGKENPDKPGNEILFVILNTENKVKSVPVPDLEDKTWHRLIDTSLDPDQDFIPFEKEKILEIQNIYKANPRSIILLHTN